LFIDVVQNKAQIKKQLVSYFSQKGNERKIEITLSKNMCDVNSEPSGITLLISDVTEREQNVVNTKKMSLGFVVHMSLICVYVFIYAFFQFLFPDNFPRGIFIYVIYVMAIVYTAVFFHFLSLNSLKQTFLINKKKMLNDCLKALLFALGVAGLILLAKYLIIQNNPNAFPSELPFYNFDRLIPGKTLAPVYLVSCFFQEVMIHVLVQDNLGNIFDAEKNKQKKQAYSILLTSLFFTAFHIPYGFIMMLVCLVFMTLMCLYYNKCRNIWSCSIIHIILGEVVAATGIWMVNL